MATTSGKARDRKTAAPKAAPGRRIAPYGLCFLAGCALTAAVFAGVGRLRSADFVTTPATRPTLDSHYDLLSMDPVALAKLDLAVVNLLCAKGLPGAESLDIPAVQAKLDEWARKSSLRRNATSTA